MYQDLRSKLAMYKDNQSKPASPVQKKGPDVHELLAGTASCSDEGACFVMEGRYPLNHMYGGCRLGDALGVAVSTFRNLSSDLRNLCADASGNPQIKDYLFLDTETTGLSSGVGTVAFLVGVGFFTDDAFIIRQYFMRDYNEEFSMLGELNRLMEGYKGLVTFNGKSFDWNLLHSRFIFNRMRPAIREPAHIDLLFPSRMIWKLKLESCKLSSIEENVLGEGRVDDILGAMIPGIYFKYLDDRNAADIKKVIKHNELDILSMVSLLVRICSMLDSPLSRSGCEKELLGIGRIFESSGERSAVIDCYESCVRSESFMVRELASKRLGNIYKKARDYDKAVEHWQRMLSSQGILGIYPMVELAKYYEHRAKDIQKAMDIVNKAIDTVLKTGLRDSAHYKELKKRLERLNRKAGRSNDA